MEARQSSTEIRDRIIVGALVGTLLWLPISLLIYQFNAPNGNGVPTVFGVPLFSILSWQDLLPIAVSGIFLLFGIKVEKIKNHPFFVFLLLLSVYSFLMKVIGVEYLEFPARTKIYSLGYSMVRSEN